MTMHTESHGPAAALDPAALPGGFYSDQGALFLARPAGGGAARDPVELARVAAAVAARELYVPPEVAKEIASLAAELRQQPARRRAEALVTLVLSERPAEALDVAVRLGILRQLVPDLDRLRTMPRRQGLYKDVYRHTLQVLAATPPDLITRLAALFHDVAKPDTLVVEGGVARFPNHDLLGADRAARRLRALCFDKELVAAVETLVRLHLRANSYEENWTDSAVRRLHLDAGEQWQRLLDLSYADVTSARPDAVARARRRVQELAEHAASLDRPVEVSPLDGYVLMQRFGRGPGRWIGDVKQRLLELVRSGELDPADLDAAWAAAEEFLRARG